ncbi:hypothetical protein SDC9_85470 [bioreactor metagenome]|uniref:Uncharacterized protein n=1 Tax=bioreactor metagenome TaxID=1076179 RepID=A0A644ZD92_9ZZZZ
MRKNRAIGRGTAHIWALPVRSVSVGASLQREGCDRGRMYFARQTFGRDGHRSQELRSETGKGMEHLAQREARGTIKLPFHPRRGKRSFLVAEVLRKNKVSLVVILDRLVILCLGHMFGRRVFSPSQLILFAQIPLQRLLFGTLPLVTLAAADQDGNRPQTLDVGTENLQDAGERNGDEHTRNPPDIAPKREGDKNDKGREIQLAALQAWVDDVAQNHLGADRQNSYIEDRSPIGCKLHQGHEDGQRGDDDRTDGRDEVEHKGQNTPEHGKIQSGDDSGKEEEHAGKGTEQGFENEILRNLAGDALKHDRHLHALALGNGCQQLGNYALPFQKEEEKEDINQCGHFGDTEKLIGDGGQAADGKTGPVDR